VLHKKIFSNKFDLFWTRTIFLYIEEDHHQASSSNAVVERLTGDPKIESLIPDGARKEK
jgi:hypothetical protein